MSATTTTTAANRRAAAAKSAASASSSDSAGTGAPIVARVGLIGASGYAGQELARLAMGHPGLDVIALCSREHAGRPAGEVLPGIDERVSGLPAFLDPATLEERVVAGDVDTLIVSLPHGAWKTLAAERPELARRPARIVDLSSDHRDGTGGYCYGLPEMSRAEVAGATRLANPGCYPTAATLALLPAAESGWIAGPVTVSALSGVSGAGRSAALRTSFVELEGGASIYRAGEEHAHVPEMKRNLARLGVGRAAVAGSDGATGRAGTASDIELGFVPHLVPMARGILLTATAPLARPITPEEAHQAWAERFAGEPFVRVLDPGQFPETRSVSHSNRCDLQVLTIHGGRTLLAMAALDNLVKGAAGQAVQNLNLMLGWAETTGLTANGTPW